MLPGDSGFDGNMSAAWLPVNETRDKFAHEGHPDDPDLHHVAKVNSEADLERNFH